MRAYLVLQRIQLNLEVCSFQLFPFLADPPDLKKIIEGFVRSNYQCTEKKTSARNAPSYVLFPKKFSGLANQGGQEPSY